MGYSNKKEGEENQNYNNYTREKSKEGWLTRRRKAKESGSVVKE